MFWPFRRKKKEPLIREKVTADVPKVKIRGVVDSYSRRGDMVEMDLTVGRASICCPVGKEIQALFPVGTEVYLVMEKKP